MAEWSTAPLADGHDRGSFDCGVVALNDYLRKYARQNGDRHVGLTFVATKAESPGKIDGYYTVASASIAFSSAPQGLLKGFPKYPVPCALIGRLAVDRSCQGRRLGETLLMSALQRVARLAETELAIAAVIVDAKDENAKRFYQKYGFVEIPGDPMRLILLTASIQEIFS